MRGLRRKRGATAAEYGLIVSLVAVLSVGALSQLGGNLNATLYGLAGAIGEDGELTLEEFMQFFTDYDANNNGSMTEAEVDAMLAGECHGDCPTGSQMISEADGQDGAELDGELDVAEWEWWHENKPAGP
jgi:Flp pilus assembly pilin Flp